jgi:hypothetical protein
MPTDHTAVSSAPHEQILNIVMGFWKSRALAVAAELELADRLVNSPLSADTLADQTKTDAASLFRLLRVLESIGVLQQVSPGVFANTPASNCLRKDVPGSQWATVRTILSVGYGQYEAWGGLLGSIQTGEAAFDQVFGCNAWEWYPRHPEVFSAFNETMRSLSAMITPAVTAAYDWSRFPVIADVGGGIGTQLADILNAHPTCHGILWDQPNVVAGAITHDRMKAMGGDFFKSVPAGADAYILRWILHDWANPEAISILNNVREAMKPGSCLVLIEEVIPEPPKPTFGMWLDPHMLVMHRGRERTATEYGELYAQSGFELEEIVPTASPISLIVVTCLGSSDHGLLENGANRIG